MTRISYSTWVKPACCVSKISSDGGCQSKETGVGMEVRLSSVGAIGFFLAASRLSFAASPVNVLSPPTRKKPLAPRVPCISLNSQIHRTSEFIELLNSSKSRIHGNLKIIEFLTGQYKTWTTDYGLRTGYRTRTRYKTWTKHYGLGIKYGLGRYKSQNWRAVIKCFERSTVERIEENSNDLSRCLFINAVAKWPAAGQGFKITKWPAVRYFSQIKGIEGIHPIETMICRLRTAKRSRRAG